MDFISIHAHLGIKFFKEGLRSSSLVFFSILKHFTFAEYFKLLCNSVTVRPDYKYLVTLSLDELKKLLYINFCNKLSSRN